MDNEIELTGDSIQERSQYFSTRIEFRTRLSALKSLSSLSKTNLIYGTITVKEKYLDQEDLSRDWADDAIANLEDLFIKNVRVPRKYVRPESDTFNKRESDRPDCKKI